MRTMVIAGAFALALLGGSVANADVPGSGAVRYVTLPEKLDPVHRHLGVPMRVGSRLFFRPQLLARQSIPMRDGRLFEQSISIDAKSSITRLSGETRIVEPDGTTWHLSPRLQLDAGTGSYRHIVIPPGEPVPAYLNALVPDFTVE